jgi:hypothetical protein
LVAVSPAHRFPHSCTAIASRPYSLSPIVCFEEAAEPHPPAREIADKMKTLNAANRVEATAERTVNRSPITAIEPVTTRIGRRMLSRRSLTRRLSELDGIPRAKDLASTKYRINHPNPSSSTQQST